MEWLKQILKWFGTNEYILGFATILSILGFLITIMVERRTATTNKILKHNNLAKKYNIDRKAYSNSFMGHSLSITKDNDHSTELVNTIYKSIVVLRDKYNTILSFKTKFCLRSLSRQLSKKNDIIDFHKVSKQLVLLSGYLEKKEENVRGT